MIRRPAASAWLCVALLLTACGGSEPEAGAAPEAVAAAPRLAAVALPAATVTLQALADDVDVPNPDRGFYRWAALDLDTLSTPEAVAVFEADAQAAYAAGYRILYARVRLDDYRSTAALPPQVLEAVRAGFAAARRSGVRLLLRFVYNDGFLPGTTVGEDAPLPIVLAQLKQLRGQRLLSDDADAIAFVQAGFVGAWGEWHGSSNNLTEPAAMAKIRDALMAALAPDQYLQMRNPQHLIALYPQLPKAGSRKPQARIGLHNDCFLASDTDVGSYSSDPVVREQQRSYVASLGQTAPFGGETCWPPDAAQARMACEHILAEGRRYALTYLNDVFYMPFMDGWRTEGCYATVKASMGYRLRLKTASYPAAAARGGAVTVNFSVDNAGWARVFKPHDVRLVLRHADSGYLVAAMGRGDPSAWLPGEETPPVYGETVSAKLPKAAPAGSYDVCLALPDSRLPGDARFAIRPANADDAAQEQAWDAGLGAFCVGTLTVN